MSNQKRAPALPVPASYTPSMSPALNAGSPAPSSASSSSATPATAPTVMQICNQPGGNESAFTNFVYMNPDEKFYLRSTEEKQLDYVEVGTCAFAAKPMKEVKVGTVGMNMFQRASSGYPDVNSMVVPQIWTPSALSMLVSLELHLDTFPVKLFKYDYDEEKLQELLRQRYLGHPLTERQTFCTKGPDGTILTFLVTRMTAPEESKTSQNLVRTTKRGIFHEKTKIKIRVKPDRVKWITLKEIEEAPEIVGPDFNFEKLGIGGLDKEFSQIFRRAFASRIWPPTVIEEMGIKHVRGMLLHGPPGTGKTLIARQIGKMLHGREPKIVNGPEILNKFVGQSEENIRNLFKEAEEEYEEKKEKSQLHIIIFDEIDAICKQRGTMTGSTGVHDTVVNQLLSKLDGVNQLNNILVIGMTNRKDLIDQALLRPGRLEVHVEIGLPDEPGREQIFNIHTRKLREHKKLAADVDLKELAAKTKNFSGAEIEGVVKSACSYALYGSIDVTRESDLKPKVDAKNIQVTMEHFLNAIGEVEPCFGVQDDELKNYVRGPIIEWGPEFVKVQRTCTDLLMQVRTSSSTQLMSVLFQGPAGCGKTALAASLALRSEFPFIKIISAEKYLGYAETAKCLAISKVFEDAYKSPLSLVIFDDIERLLEFVPINMRFSNAVLQTIMVCLKRVPPKEGHRLMVFGTTSSPAVLSQMTLKQTFNICIKVPLLTQLPHLYKVLDSSERKPAAEDIKEIAAVCPRPIGIKQLLMLIDMAGVSGQPMNARRFQECVANYGLQTQVTEEQTIEGILKETAAEAASFEDGNGGSAQSFGKDAKEAKS